LIGLDTSVLVALAIRDHPLHDPAWTLFQGEIVGRDGAMALAPQVLTEFAHVVSDPRRFEAPLSMHDALAIAERWWGARECRQVRTGRAAVAIFLDWMALHDVGRKRLLDTMLAATYRAEGVERLATSDWRDFSVYGEFEILPIADPGDGRG
jgi:predicted nucleic acid-binding protein